jgi:hypothetical protein
MALTAALSAEGIKSDFERSKFGNTTNAQIIIQIGNKP